MLSRDRMRWTRSLWPISTTCEEIKEGENGRAERPAFFVSELQRIPALRHEIG